MADFNTHMTGAAVASAMLASTTLATGILSPTQSMVLWVVGMFAGLLPDIDSDASTSLKLIFSLLGVLASFIVVSFSYGALNLLMLWGAMFTTFVLVRYAILFVFARWTVHRGIFHTVVAAILFALLAVVVASELQAPLLFSWYLGLAIFLGYITHLLLDELASIDLAGLSIKRSFGSAFKLFSIDNWAGSLVMCLVIGLLYFQTPKPIPFIDQVSMIRLQEIIMQIFVKA